MKTHKKLSDNELKLIMAKSSINFNHRLLNDVLNFVYEKITDIDTLTFIYDRFDEFVELLDAYISKSLSNYETDSKENTH